MADFAPPSGPPPPKVPEGWKALWNDQYHEWFYVNLHTKQSQWERPTEPIYLSDSIAPPGPPPAYDPNNSNSKLAPGEKSGSLSSNNPYNSGHGSSSSNDIDADARYAAQLQAEEDAKVRDGFRNAQTDYVNTSMSPGYEPQLKQQFGGSDKGKSKGGFLGKLLGKHSGGQVPQSYRHYGSPSPVNYSGSGQYGYQPQQRYGGYPQQGYPQQGYGYPQQEYGGYQQQQVKKKGGLGTAGAAALGVGGGLVGGMLLADAIDDHDEHEYDQGYQDGADGGGFDGGDDFGGDF
ncbi:MAG: hypothetical protein M1834_009055 [Cirrosporium novae-zelandiae]|nr:MAG: hypothetical protein M1834_009055 [Cirrosporium novae-zelandiae]